MIKPDILQITNSIWSAISLKKDKNGDILQFKQCSYSLPVIDEKETKRNILGLIKSLRVKYTVHDISILLMECLDEAKFQYMLSHNGFRLAKNTPKDKRVVVADIYAFSQALTYCFLFLPPEIPIKPLIIVSGVMAPADQDLGCTLFRQLWQTQGHTVFDLGTKIKPHAWHEAIDDHQPDFLSISCMLNSCIANLQELLGLLSARKDRPQVCVGGMAINKFKALQLSQEYRVPLFYGENFIGIQKNSEPDHEDQVQIRKTINLPEEITTLSLGGIACYRISLSEIIISGGNLHDTKEFLSNFNYAVIVTTSCQPVTKRDAKILIRQLLQIEKFFEEADHLAFSFYYPIPCPFCLRDDCRKDEGRCMNPAYTRPLLKTFHINLSKTMKNSKIVDLGLSTLVLII